MRRLVVVFGQVWWSYSPPSSSAGCAMTDLILIMTFTRFLQATFPTSNSSLTVSSEDVQSVAFSYIDQIAVAPQARRARIGAQLYAHAAGYARAHEIPVLVCEVNLDPPNPV